MLVPCRRISEGKGTLFSTFPGEIRIISVLSSFNCNILFVIHFLKLETQYPVGAKCVLICGAGCHQKSYDETGSGGVQCPRVVEYRVPVWK